MDITILDVKVIDGTGRAGYTADIGVKDGKIVAIGSLGQVESKLKIEATGLAVCPGFIDTHAHTDFTFPYNPIAHSELMQGVTTVLTGHCGKSAFPKPSGDPDRVYDHMGVEITPSKDEIPGSGAEFLISGPWSTPEEYFSFISGSGIAPNAAFLAGHITLRCRVMGPENRPATRSELEEIKVLLREALDAGARGLSSSLQYAPANSAPTEELIELCRVVAEYGGIYTSHLREYSYDGLFAAVDEGIRIGRESGVPVILSHMNVAGRRLWGRAGDILERVHRAQRDGVDVIADLMTYQTIGVWFAPRAIFPKWAYDWKMDWPSAVEKLRPILADPSSRGRLAEEIEARRSKAKTGLEEKMVFSDWSRIILDRVAPGSTRGEYLGWNMAELAEAEGAEPAELFLELIDQEGSDLFTINMTQHEDDYYQMVQDPYVALGCTDSLGLSPHMLDQPFFKSIQLHPRHFGSYPRVLEKYVRKEKVLSMEEAVRRMTSLPASIVGLLDRGTIARGKAADLVVFDPYLIGEQGTLRDPVAFPKGINYIIVNGQVVVENGQFTNTWAGQVL